mgnify:CR=1 FL=1
MPLTSFEHEDQARIEELENFLERALGLLERVQAEYSIGLSKKTYAKITDFLKETGQ